MAWLAASLRRLREGRLVTLGFGALVVAIAFAAAAAPRVAGNLADATLRATLDQAPAFRANLRFIELTQIPEADPGTTAGIAREAAALFEQLPAAFRAVIGERGWTADSARWRVPLVGGDPTTLRFRFEPGATDRLHLVSGSWPTGASSDVPNRLEAGAGSPPVTAFEVALSSSTAAALGAVVGDVIPLAPDPTDTLATRGAAQPDLAARVVGIYTVVDPADRWWLDDPALDHPSIRSTGGDTEFLDTVALIAPAAYGSYLQLTAAGLLRYTFREYVDPARLTAGDVDRLLTAARRVEVDFPAVTRVGGSPSVSEGLRVILETYRAQWASAVAVLAIAVAGPAVVALAALVLVAGLAGRRRRPALVMARNRGASPGQLALAVAAEGFVVSGAAAIVAVALAAAVVPGGPSVASLVAAVAVAVTATGLLLAASLGGRGSGIDAPGRATGEPAHDGAAVPGRPSRRRLVLEGSLVAGALGAAWLLRERGLGIAGAATVAAPGVGGAGASAPIVDPVVAAVPALVALAAGAVLLRVLPWVMGLTGRLVGRQRGVVAVVGFRRAADGRRFGPSLVALLVTAAIWAFASSVVRHLDAGADLVAWRETGAAFRIDSATNVFAADFDPSTIPGVVDAVGVHRETVDLGQGFVNVELVVLPLDAYARITADTPAALDVPLDLYASTPPAVQMLVSSAVADRPDGVRPGDDVDAYIGGYKFPIHVAGIVGDLPGLADSDLFAIAPEAQMVAIHPNVILQPSVYYLRAAASDEAAIRAAVALAMPGAGSVAAEASTAAAIRDTPVARAIATGMGFAAVLAFAFAALVVAAGLALAGAAEAVETAHLRTLGLTRGQAAAIVALEHGPLIAIAFAAGLGLGAATFQFVLPGLGLDAVVGAAVVVPLRLAPVELATILGGIVALVVVGLVAGTIAQRGAAAPAAIRRGFE